MTKRKPVEIKDSTRRTPPKKLVKTCISCGKVLDVDPHTNNNANVFPNIHGGVVFRSTGQYGSTVWDGPAHSNSPYTNEIQVIVCDECITSKAEQVNTFKNERTVIERRPFADVATKWSEYATYKEYEEYWEKKRIAREKKETKKK